MLTLLYSDPLLLVLLLPILLLSLTVHEVCHGYAALKCGDKTAQMMGRLTLNPLAHLDLRGALMLLVAGFGWAKPVPINPRNFRKPKRDIAIVSVAGPLANILMCFLSVVLYYVCLWAFGLLDEANVILDEADAILQNSHNFSLLSFNQTFIFQMMAPQLTGGDIPPALQCTVLQVFSLSSMINAGLAVFNLIPIPPLDGSKILASLLPNRAAVVYLRAEKYIIYAFMGLVAINLLGSTVPFFAEIADTLFYPVTFLRQGLLRLFETLMQLIFR